MHVDVVHQPGKNQFVATADGKDSFLRYRPLGGEALDLVSTFVHGDLRGRGIGEKLVREALDYARGEGLLVVPTCWFVDTVIDRHPEYRELVRT